MLVKARASLAYVRSGQPKPAVLTPPGLCCHLLPFSLTPQPGPVRLLPPTLHKITLVTANKDLHVTSSMARPLLSPLWNFQLPLLLERFLLLPSKIHPLLIPKLLYCHMEGLLKH